MSYIPKKLARSESYRWDPRKAPTTTATKPNTVACTDPAMLVNDKLATVMLFATVPPHILAAWQIKTAQAAQSSTTAETSTAPSPMSASKS